MINIAAIAEAIHKASDPPIKGVISFRGGLISQQPNVDYTIEAVKSLDMFITIEQFMTDTIRTMPIWYCRLVIILNNMDYTPLIGIITTKS